jgi:hypothetical protein
VPCATNGAWCASGEGSRQHHLLHQYRPEVDTQQKRQRQHHGEEHEQEHCPGPHGSAAFPASGRPLARLAPLGNLFIAARGPEVTVVAPGHSELAVLSRFRKIVMAEAQMTHNPNSAR